MDLAIGRLASFVLGFAPSASEIPGPRPSPEGVVGYAFHSWLPAIIAGVAVYRVKPWSYPVFLACILYGSYVSGHLAFGGVRYGTRILAFP